MESEAAGRRGKWKEDARGFQEIFPLIFLYFNFLI
jgi:hypothetical protein